MAASAEWMLPATWTVAALRRETADVVTLELAPGPDTDADASAFAPGQFNMLYVFGVGEVPISICGTRDGRVLHTVRDVGAVSHALCSLESGALVGLRGPFGSSWPIAAEHGRDIVVVAGGIGLAPLRPVIDHVVDRREDYDDVVVLYGARTPDELLFTDAYDDWRAHDVQVEVTVDSAGATWTGSVGVVTTLIRRARFDTEEAAAFLCGPEIMMRFVAQELELEGVDNAHIYVSMERNMKCAIGLCGHCQLGPAFVCLDGPVFAWPQVRDLVAVRGL